MEKTVTAGAISVHGARQNNLKNLSLDLPLDELIVVTGVSGSGKSSLVFDTLYAEGQRRYVETFSPYARQFLDRMDKPQVDRIDGVPPAIAIDQTNPVRTSRSTVGTMTELNDHLKLLFARAAQLYCRGCGRPVMRDTADSIYSLLSYNNDEEQILQIVFPVPVPKNFSEKEIVSLLERQGYTRIHAKTNKLIEVVQDRVRFASHPRERVIESLELAFKIGQGRVSVYPIDAQGNAQTPRRFSSDLHCADCDIHYQEPTPSAFSFNSPIGACESCRGFGRTIGIDFGLVIPDESKSLGGGAIKPWQTQSFNECQDDLAKFAKKRAVPMDIAWRELDEGERHWVLEGDADWISWNKSWPGTWYGVRRFFAWLETKSYKMHIRVLLSKYRAYTPCAACDGARLKPESLLWRLGTHDDADRTLAPAQRFRARGDGLSDLQFAALPGLTLHDIMLLPIERTRELFHRIRLAAPLDQASDLVLKEIRTRLDYLLRVGLGYLTLDRQSRTLSGGEVQRINLTTALGTSLTNTLFVLDEPSIGLHPRDMGRVIDVMQRLRDAGNSLVVVEHDPQMMSAADRILDMGPGPGERGGEVVFFGAPGDLVGAQHSLTADYLSGRKQVAVLDEALASEPTDKPHGHRLEILGAQQHNLKAIDVTIPLNRLVCITGVSGSGKSTLVQDVLYAALLKHKGKPTETPGAHRTLRGHEHIGDVVMVDQSPIGRTTRSNPASYVGAFDAIRKAFAAEPLARERGYTLGTFSFNSGSGRCPTCGGNGFEHVEMQFLSDVYLRCPDCNGRRYRDVTLEVRLAAADGKTSKSIADVLDLTVSEAVGFFASNAEVLRSLEPLAAVGLDYLKLGQPVPTLSGGEAQRLKLAGFLAEAKPPHSRPLPREAGGEGENAVPQARRKRAKPRSAAASVAQSQPSHKKLAPKDDDSARASPGFSGERDRVRGKLFLFDEPTTGLHFDDIAKLLRAFRQLVAAGHSLIVIEHNLDVIRAADWVIDLGPEGGDAGGAIVCTGTPQQVSRHESSHTGRALRDYVSALSAGGSPVKQNTRQYSATGAQRALPSRQADITIHRAREHNLKNIDVAVPRDCFTVITGVSGSGKSTVAFDILFAEGQRRYLESLNAYARQFVQPAGRPDVDAIFGIPPTVAIEQRTSRGGRKSTVATLTEIYHFLRLLFVKLGTQYCPDCDVAISPQSVAAITAGLLREYKNQSVILLAPLVIARKGYYTDLAKWAASKGFTYLRVDGELLPTAAWPRLDRFKEHTIELPIGELDVRASNEAALREQLVRALDFGKGVMHLVPAQRSAGAGGNKTTQAARVFSTRRACPNCARSFPELDPRLFSFNSKHGWCPACFGTGVKLQGFDEQQSGEEVWWNDWWEGDAAACPSCDGKRLNTAALAVRFRDHSIAALAALPVQDLKVFFAGIRLHGREVEIARDIAAELVSRLSFLQEVGLSYLALDRAAPTLSGGEAQRIRLAAQLGSNLRGVCYILDEPTIGLHPRDNRMLLDTLAKLRLKGNTLVVVEHDEDTIRRAQHLIDLGPSAGKLGGELVAQGSLQDLMNAPRSLTGQFLAQPLRHPFTPRRPVDRQTPSVKMTGTTLHNLKRLNARVPLARLVCVTGVSGSGKSTLVRDVLRTNLQRLLAGERRRKRAAELVGCRALQGWQEVARVLEVDQTPIGKTPRSCPATYVGFWDIIRRVFAETSEARMRGYTAARFSFNVSGGRCDACDGQGLKTIEMSFLPNVKVRCEVCRGVRFNTETLAVRFKDKSIGDVLAMNVDEAALFFAAHRAIHHPLMLLKDVGLGYLTLGQQSPTLSGGEAQRIKLVTELSKVKPEQQAFDFQARNRPVSRVRHTLYVLDEPTVGLHMADVEKLIRVLHRLVDAGNTVVVIEHNLDMMAEADWILDLGPEGGDAGGQIVAQGAPEQVAKAKTHTGEFLAEFLRERSASH